METTMAIPANVSIMDFVQRFRNLQVQRDQNDELIKDLLVYCEIVESTLRAENARLIQELHDTQLDLEDSKRSRRELQQELNRAVQIMSQTTADRDQMRNRNPYIVVLIDGDGMIFNEDLICQGIEGGKVAANTLRSSVLESWSDLPEEIEVMAKICANVSGLGKAMQRDGCLANIEDLRDFTLGFSQGKASFDFVDVGHEKERVDSKIKECIRFHLRNHNCRQILLGVSHDASYAPFLDELLNQEDRSRITILEGPPTVHELTNTGLQVINFTNIFRAEKLVNRAIPIATPANTWAGVTSIIPPPSTSPVNVKTISRKATPVQSPPKITWIPEPRGLDPAITVNPIALEKIKRRTTNNKLCNNHYLRGPCSKGDECCFEHDYKATDEDIKAIAYLTRLNPCTNGQDCDQEFCIYGHHCPSINLMNKDPVCMSFGCRFGPEAHPPGTVIKHPRKEKWEYEQRY